MKDRKRAYRRYKKEIKFKKRIKNWARGSYSFGYKNREEWIDAILKGETSTFLRTTGTPCNCWMCSGENKYQRPQKQYIKKEIENDEIYSIIHDDTFEYHQCELSNIRTSSKNRFK